MKFEFDPAKSASNKTKHGLDFIEAQALWNSRVVEIQANTIGSEVRYAALGMINGTIFLVVLTYRGNVRRLISARPATSNEAAIYAKNIRPNP